MLDLVTVIGVLAVFAILGLLARGVERLGPRVPSPDSRGSGAEGDRA